MGTNVYWPITKWSNYIRSKITKPNSANTTPLTCLSVVMEISFLCPRWGGNSDYLYNMVRDADFYIFYFKTVSCPYNQIKHDKKQCPYAHNWQDFRRVPDIYNYAPEVCEHWKTDTLLMITVKAAQNKLTVINVTVGRNCIIIPWFSRWNLVLIMRNAPKELICPFYHNDLDKRYSFWEIFWGNSIFTEDF